MRLGSKENADAIVQAMVDSFVEDEIWPSVQSKLIGFVSGKDLELQMYGLDNLSKKMFFHLQFLHFLYTMICLKYHFEKISFQN